MSKQSNEIRLVDANAFLKLPLINGEYDKENANEHFIFGIETAAEMIENLPIAFDLDFFVKELKAEIGSISNDAEEINKKIDNLVNQYKIQMAEQNFCQSAYLPNRRSKEDPEHEM